MSPSAELPDPDPEVLATVTPPPRRTWLWALGLGLVGLGVVGGVVWQTRDTGSPWITAEAVVDDVVQTVSAVGTLEAVDVVEVGSDQSGIVDAVNVEVNDRVTQGQVLATLDPEPFDADVSSAKAQVASARASVAEASARLKVAQSTLARSQSLHSREVLSDAELESDTLAVDTARASVDVARASLDQARAALTKAERSRADAVILSPIDGVVLARNVDAGQTVVSTMSATTLFSVAKDLALMEVEVAVDESDVGVVQPGQPARFTVPAWPDRAFDAEVVRVDLAPTDDTVVTYPTLLRIVNADGALRPGMTATATLEVARWNAVVTVPASALRFEPDGGTPDASHLYRLEGEQPVVTPITVVGQDGSRVGVEGLDAGAVVITGTAR